MGNNSFKNSFGARNSPIGDERYTPPEAVAIILPYIPDGSRVWCPFDTEDSWFAKLIREHGCEVIATHIRNGQDFFETDVDCDYIVSNPPFSKKTEIFRRLYEIGKPFAMLCSLSGIFDHRGRWVMFRAHEPQLLIPNRRVHFMSPFSDVVEKNTPFQSAYVCERMLPKQIVFAEMRKDK